MEYRYEVAVIRQHSIRGDLFSAACEHVAVDKCEEILSEPGMLWLIDGDFKWGYPWHRVLCVERIENK